MFSFNTLTSTKTHLSKPSSQPSIGKGRETQTGYYLLHPQPLRPKQLDCDSLNYKSIKYGTELDLLGQRNFIIPHSNLDDWTLTHSGKSSKNHKVKGFSLIEIIISTSVFCILMSFAAPSLGSIIDRTRVTTTSMMVHQTLSVARSNSISSGRIVHVCQLASISPIKCVESHKQNDSWADGWLVFIDNDYDNELGPEDRIVRIFDPSPQTKVIFNQRGRLRFFPDGSSRSAGFYVCGQTSNEFKHIKLLYSGRPRTVTSTDPKRLDLCQSA